MHLCLAGLLSVLATLAGIDQTQPRTAVTESSSAQGRQGSDEAAVVGDWKGESLVVAKNTPAKDEVVVWHIAKGREPGTLRVRADKIVNGRTITMGTLPFKYDKAQKTIVCEYRQGVWRLTVKENSMEGSLTTPDGTIFRRVKLERSE
jgi:hypothetical protein